MMQGIQLFGAVLILIAFALHQARKMDAHGAWYLTLNFVGSVILAILAGIEWQSGFLLLEGVWAIVSGYGLVMLILKQHRPASN